MESSLQPRTVLIAEGVIFSVLGILAIMMPVISTISAELFIGALFLCGGGVQLYRSLTHKADPFKGNSLITGIFYALFGALLLFFPMAGILSLTILLTIFFIVDGIGKSVLAFQMKPAQRWGWFLVSGILSLVLAFLIWSGWPGTAFWVLGLLVGINLLFFGLALISYAFNLPKE